MTAIGQGNGNGGDGAQAAAQQTGGGAQAQDVSGLLERLDGLTQGQEQMREFLASNPWAQAQAQHTDQDQGDRTDQFGDLSFLDEPTITPDQLKESLNGLITAAVQQHVQQAVGPVAQQAQELRRDQEARDLVSEFPELATEEMANKVAGKGGLASTLAQNLGHPELAGDPKMWRVAYMLHKAAESANQQGASGPDAAHLESGHGAGPAGQQELSLKERIVSRQNGARGASVLQGM